MDTVALQRGVTSQYEISAEISEIAAEWRRNGRAEDQPRIDYPPYRSIILRHPKVFTDLNGDT